MKLSFHRLAGSCKLSPEAWTVTHPGEYVILGFVLWAEKRGRHVFRPEGSAEGELDAEELKEVASFIAGLDRKRKRCRNGRRRRG